MENDSLDSVNEYFKHLGKITQEIDREEMSRLWKLVKKGDKDAKNKIMEMNLRLVIPTAKRLLFINRMEMKRPLTIRGG